MIPDGNDPCQEWISSPPNPSRMGSRLFWILKDLQFLPSGVGNSLPQIPEVWGSKISDLLRRRPRI